MKLRTHLLAAAGVIIASIGSAHADTLRGYLEVGAGGTIMNKVDTKTYAVSSPAIGGTFNGHLELNYKNGPMFSGEVGVGGLAKSTVRLGLSYDYTQADLDHAEAVGKLNGSAINEGVRRDVLTAYGINLDNTVHLVQAQAYYNLPPIGGRFRAFIGAGAGIAAFSHADSEAVMSVTVGGRYAVSNNMYVGVRARGYRIDGPSDDFGTKFRSLETTSVMITLGGYF